MFLFIKSAKGNKLNLVICEKGYKRRNNSLQKVTLVAIIILEMIQYVMEKTTKGNY
jgi:hypothetical protein